MNPKTVLFVTLKFLIAFGLVAWLATNGMLDFSSLTVLVDYRHFAVLALLILLNLLVNNIRWTAMLKMKGFGFTNKHTFPLTLIGTFFNYAMPGGLGGDVVKGYYLLKRSSDSRTSAAISVLMDRLIGMYGMVMVSVVGIAVEWAAVESHPELQVLALLVMALFLGMTAFFAISFSVAVYHHPLVDLLFRKLPGGAFLNKLYEVVHSYRNHPTSLLYFLFLSLVSQLLIVVFVWYFAWISGVQELMFSIYLFAVPLALISTVLPVTPGGIGVGQAAAYYLFGLFTGIEGHFGPDAITAYQVVLFGWGLFGAYFYVTARHGGEQQLSGSGKRESDGRVVASDHASVEKCE